MYILCFYDAKKSPKVSQKYNNKNFYNEIPIFQSWEDYIIEEIIPGCKIPINRIEDINELIVFLGNDAVFIFIS
jgi:hypothetical protein